jgi:hypothetical protein
MKTRIVFFVALTLVAQRILGAPGFPAWFSDLNIVAVWIVALSMLSTQRGWPYEALALGITWDLVLSQPVIGPGGIAWSATALGLAALAGVVADRSPKAWAGFGALAAPAITLIHWLCLLPLGLEFSLTAAHLLRSALLTGLWCGLVGFVLAIDLPKHLRNMRLRKLR